MKHTLTDIKSTVFDIESSFLILRNLLASEDTQKLASPAPLFGDTSMIRRRLLIATALVATVVLTACSDATAPTNTCQVTSGSNVCDGQ